MNRFLIALCVLFAWLMPACASARTFSWKVLHEYAERYPAAERTVLQSGIPLPEQRYVEALQALLSYRTDEADAVFTEILQREPGHIGARWGMVELLRRTHQYEKSAGFLQEIIRLAPDFAPAYISLGYIRYLQRDFEETVRLTAQVIELDAQADAGSLVRAHCLYAGAKGVLAHYGGPLSKSVNGPAVRRHLSLARQLWPEHVAVQFGYGSYYLLSPDFLGRDLDKAELFLKKTIEMEPDFPDAYARLSQVYSLRGDQEKATELLAAALRLDPENEIALDIKNDTDFFICVHPAAVR